MAKRAKRGIFYLFLLVLVFGISFGTTYVVITKPFARTEQKQENTPTVSKPSYEELEQKVEEQQALLEEQEALIEEKDKRILELEEELDSKASPKATATPKAQTTSSPKTKATPKI